MRQNDVGTQYRPASLRRSSARRPGARATNTSALSKAGHGAITTEILPAPEFYCMRLPPVLSKNPNGYCGLEGTGVSTRPASTLRSESAFAGAADGRRPSRPRLPA
jgi:peptide-methionine (S)-S-oxide reductase